MHSVCSYFFLSLSASFSFFFFNDTATTEIYTLSLHDALPIYQHVLGELARDLHGLVLRLGVDDDDLVRPGHALQAGPEPGLLVERDDDGGQARPCRHPRSSRVAAATDSTSIVSTRPSDAWRVETIDV